MSDTDAGSSALEALAARSGIEPSFRDARGNVRKPSEQTKRALLDAMGLSAGNEAEAAETLQRLDELEWKRSLPPVQVSCIEAAPAQVQLTLPAGTSGITWVVRTEDGGEISGKAEFGALDLTESRELEGQVFEKRTLDLGYEIPWGYHTLALTSGGAQTVLIITPGRCWLPHAVAQGDRLWGVAAQLYLLRSAGNWGIGDYGDLQRLVKILADRGADVVGLNPLHAMFLDDPEHASPYSPASRLLLNVLNIDVPSLPELAACAPARELIRSADFQQRLEACRSAAVLDYAGVAELKMQVLNLLFETFATGRGPDRQRAFKAFRQERGKVLERTCLFQTIREHFAAQDHAIADWHGWPDAYQNPESPEVAEFAKENEKQVTFRVWLQWLADSQLSAAAAEADGMEIGLYRDLAVGADRSGAETWANQAAVVSDAQVGAPPDIFYPAGQNWGLPPFNPRALREEGYRSFIDLVQANMRHAGGLRIDHVMALQHLYWVPTGLPPSDGAYVKYNLDDLVGILALESQRRRCLIVGEDLGTVPEGFRERMEEAGVLSYRVLFFEKDDDSFVNPADYPPVSLAVAGNHDMPTLRGWWNVADVDLKEKLKLFPDQNGPAEGRKQRAIDSEQLVEAFRTEGLLASGDEVDAESLISLAHRFLARTKSVLAMAQIDDIVDEADPVNVPSTSSEHPNWRRRLSVTLEEFASDARLDHIADIFAAERKHSGGSIK